MTEAATFWENHYSKMTKPSNGRPSGILVRFTEGRKPGRAMDLGCARGDDAICLAQQGWTVTGVDIAESALTAARDTAKGIGVADKVVFEQHDLAKSIPDGPFHLVSAMFLHTPVDLDRAAALRRASERIAHGGLLLIGVHGSRAPWSWAAPGTVYPNASDELADLQLDPVEWSEVFVGSIERVAIGPGGQRAQVVDMVVAIQKRTLSQ